MEMILYVLQSRNQSIKKALLENCKENNKEWSDRVDQIMEWKLKNINGLTLLNKYIG